MNEPIDVLSEHKIKDSITADLDAIMSHPYIKSFMDGQQTKYTRAKERDELAFQLLYSKCQLYAKGWIQSNANKTAELWIKSEQLDREMEEAKMLFRMLNNLSNKMINALKNYITEDNLKHLRELETEIRKHL
jgi:hypothetical protein